MEAQLQDMLNRQASYEDALWRTGAKKPDSVQRMAALLDEVGELNHEIKSHWCWWKKTQKPMDRERTIDEIADVMHFLVSQVLDKYGSVNGVPGMVASCYRQGFTCGAGRDVTRLLYGLLAQAGNGEMTDAIISLYLVAKELEYTPDEVYEAYCRKNAVNLNRVRQGY